MANWFATQIKDPCRAADDRWVSFGKVVEWLEELGITASWGPKGSVTAVKEQFVRLAFCHFSIMVRSGEYLPFMSQHLVEGGIFREDDLVSYIENRIGDMQWPEGFKITATAAEQFSKRSVPIPNERLRLVAHNAMAIDMLSFICYRLPELVPGDPELVTWRRLRDLFGGKEAVSKFRETFIESIKLALSAYPEANVELREEGLELRHSDPAVLRKAFFPGRRLVKRRMAKRPTTDALEPGLIVFGDAEGVAA